MDYQKIYNQIVERAKNRILEGYKEKHHIIPKCLGGDNSANNLVELTAREHFLCHMLLCEIYPNENKLKHALFLMAIGKQKIKEKTYIIGSRVYERLKSEYSQMLIGKKQSKETRDKKSKSMLEVWTNKTKEELSDIGFKRWETRKKNGTDKITQKQANNISKALKGRKINWDRGVNKIVLQYDLQGNFIKEYTSINEAERCVKGDISAMLRGRQKTAGGYIWKYKEN
jgi:hypothetical protein